MIVIHALPPYLFEVLDVSMGATAFVALVICLRYLVTAYLQFRHGGGLPEPAGRWQAFMMLRDLRLAVGFTIFLTGFMPFMTWAWLARYLVNTNRPEVWMGTRPWVFVPIVASGLCVLGMACVVRALVPYVWGRLGYWIAISAALFAVVLTQTFR